MFDKIKINKKISISFFALLLLIAGTVAISFLFNINSKDENIEVATDKTENSEGFSFDELGEKAQKEMDPESFSIKETDEGMVIKSDLQKIIGLLNKKGLTVESNANDEKGSFNIMSAKLYREDMIGSPIVLTEDGQVSIANNGSMAVLDKGIIKEEFSSTPDGIRQDFVINQKLSGSGELFLVLDVDGAVVEFGNSQMVNMIIDESQRKLAYNNLCVTDANGQELPAKFFVNNNKIEIAVNDKDAVYPIRIDPTITDADWVSMGMYEGLSGAVYALVFDSAGNLYVGGGFTSAGGISANYIAKWDGANWSALGSGIGGSTPYVYTLSVDSSDNLYVGGYFTTAGGTSANYIAKWDGTNWSALGSGMNSYVVSISIDSSDNLYAGGVFTTAGGISANRIAKWNGSAWSALGSGMNNYVWTLTISSSTGDLYAGGYFTTAGGISANRIAKWNGSAWSALGSGVNDYINALTVDSTGNLYAGGRFTTAGGISANRIAKWNGSAWSALGSGVAGGGWTVVSALAVDSFNNLYVGGDFTTAGGLSANYIAKWDGTTWSALGSGMNSTVQALIISSSTGDLYAGGTFTTANNNYTSRVAVWDQISWSPLEEIDFNNSINDAVWTLIFDQNDNLYIGGWFTHADGQAVNYIVKWDGSTWSALGSGMNNVVFSLAFDSAGNLYAGGGFTMAGGISANRIAKWNGSTWSALGSGMNSYVRVLTISSSTGDLYAGGDFTTAGGISANRIAKWNGINWSALGSGMNSSVWDLVFDSVGDLYAGGSFTTAGGLSANYIAKWNGTTWSNLGSGMNSSVFSLVFDSASDLYAGGGFTTAGGISANRIAKWNGTTWSNLGSGMNGNIASINIDSSDNLYAGGSFTTAGGLSANFIAKWDGTTWSVLGGGMNSNILVLAIDPFDDLYAGGYFTSAGDKQSTYLAKALTAPRYTLNYIAGANGTIFGATPQIVNEGADGTEVEAVPNVGYHFVSWSDGLLTATRTDMSVTGDITATSTFAINEYTLNYIAGANGSITGSTTQTITNGSDGTEVEAIPNVGYHFVSWSDGLLTATRTDMNVTGNISVTANFAINQYTLYYTANANGSITGSTTQTIAHGSDGTEVEAIPNVGYHFVSWSDGLLTATRTDLSVTGDITATSTFAINEYTLNYLAGANGSITGSTTQTIAHGSDGAEVEAIPNVGYHFVSWSDGVLTAKRTDINVVDNNFVTANFQITPVVTPPSSGGLPPAPPITPPDNGFSIEIASPVDFSVVPPRVEAGRVNLILDGGPEAVKMAISKEPLFALSELIPYSTNSSIFINQPGFYTIYARFMNARGIYSEVISTQVEVILPARITEPTVPEEPTEPTIPKKPIEPITPKDPVEPIIPKEPIEPIIPGEPIQPEEPIEPIIPGKPIEPIIPKDPVEPIIPEEPEADEQNDLAVEVENRSEQGFDLIGIIIDGLSQVVETILNAGQKIVNFTQEFIADPIAIIKEVNKELKAYSQTTEAKDISVTTATAVVAVTGLQFATVANTFSQIPQLIFNAFASLFDRRRKSKKRGVVYDMATGQPIPFAKVSIIKDGGIMETKYTDKYGSYFFLVPAGNYTISVIKKGYKIVNEDKRSDIKTVYNNFAYTNNQALNYTKDDMVMAGIPLVKEAKEKLTLFSGKKWIYTFLDIVFWAGFAFSIVMLVYNPDTLNQVMVGVYSILFVIKSVFITKPTWGIVKTNGKPEPFTLIQSYPKDSDKPSARTITDQKGRYALILEKGDYTLEARTPKQQSVKKDIKVKKHGVIDEKIEM